MNQDMYRIMKLFWKEVRKTNERKVESYSKKCDRSRRLALLEVEMQRIWKEYFEDFYNIDTKGQVAVYMWL